MDIRFSPTLKIIACTRIARHILNYFDLKELIVCDISSGRTEKSISNIFERAFSECFEDSRSAEGAERLILTKDFHDQCVGVVMILIVEIREWYKNHRPMFNDDNIDLRNRFIWFSFGVIDTLATAQHFIRDENLNIVDRFYMACKYYFEDDVKMLRTNMSSKEISVFLQRIPEVVSMQLWLIALQRNHTLDWSQISIGVKKSFFKDNLLGIRNYFTKLIGKPIRYWFIFFASEENSEIHPFDLYSCIYRIGTDELNVIFNRLPAKNLAAIFESFLLWPLQNMFLGFVETFLQHINAVVFCDIVKDFLFEKIKDGWNDHPYVDLFEEFLKVANDESFLQVMRNPTVNQALTYVVNSPRPLDLRAYRQFLDNL